MGTLNIGTGRADITPPPGIPQGGWGAQTHQRSQGNDLPLEVRALALKENGTTALLLDMDAIGFDGEQTARIMDAVAALTGVDKKCIRFSCTHTHSGPNTFRLPMIRQGLDMALAYIETLPSRAAGAAWQALQNLQPVNVGIAIGSCDINVNRRSKDSEGRTFVGCNLEGESDRRVHVIRFDNERGEVIASILHYACHPTTMGWQNEWVTPDYPGQAKKVVEETLGGTCLFLQGASADLGPRRGFIGDRNVYRRLGTILGLEAAKLGWNIDTQPTSLKLRGIQESGARIGLYEEVPLKPLDTILRATSQMIDLPVREHPSPDVAEANAEKRRQEARALPDSAPDHERRAANARATQAGMASDRARLYHGKSSIYWPLHLLAIGDIALVGIAGEPFQQIAREIEAQSPYTHTLVSGYTNGGFAYIPTGDEYAAGGYEVETTPFAPEAAEKLIAATVSALKELKEME